MEKCIWHVDWRDRMILFSQAFERFADGGLFDDAV